MYDRIWWPFNFVYCKLLSTSLTVDANALTTFYPPSSVMETAVTPVNSSVSLDFYWTPENPTSKFYVYMHFAEVEELQPNQTTEFNITQNGEYFIGPISPSYLYSTTAYSVYPVSGDKIQYSIFRTPKSTLPPILNGLEVYMALETTESQTDEQDGIDFILFFFLNSICSNIFKLYMIYICIFFIFCSVNAMMSIKSKYGLKRNWQGDACAPKDYLWEGLDCDYSGSDPLRIISL